MRFPSPFDDSIRLSIIKVEQDIPKRLFDESDMQSVTVKILSMNVSRPEAPMCFLEIREGQ